MRIDRHTSALVLATTIVVSAFAQETDAVPQGGSCAYDRDAMLVLSQQEFDQDMNAGWRSIAHRPDCELAAAGLIRDYREVHDNESGILYWHEGQLRAISGHTEAAIALFDRARKPDAEDVIGRNHYVDATIAFLEQDRERLLAAREALSKVPRPDDFAPVDSDGNPVDVLWPPNLHVVDDFVRCFGEEYGEAYGQCEK